MTLQIMDNGTEIRRLGISGATDIELFLHEKLRLKRYFRLSIANTNHATGEGYFVDSHLIGLSTTYSLDYHVGTEAGCHLQNTRMHIVIQCVNHVTGSHLPGQHKFIVVDIGGNNCRTTLCRTHNSAHSHHTAANNHHHINIGHLCPRYGMETHTHRFYQRTLARREQTCGYHLLPWQAYGLFHGAIALNA